MTTHKEAIKRAHDAYCYQEAGGWEEDFILAIRAYLDARGLVMVPREPTQDMVDAALDAPVGEIYTDMLAAAPDPFGDAP